MQLKKSLLFYFIQLFGFFSIYYLKTAIVNVKKLTIEPTKEVLNTHYIQNCFGLFPLETTEYPLFLDAALFKNQMSALKQYCNRYPDVMYLHPNVLINDEKIEKAIAAFESHYDLAFNKNYLKKLKLILTSRWFVIIILFMVAPLFFCKSYIIILKYLNLLPLIVLVYFFYYKLFPCSLNIFIQRFKMKNLKEYPLLSDLLGYLNHPLHNKTIRNQAICFCKQQVALFFHVLNTLNNQDPTYSIAFVPFFPRPLPINIPLKNKIILIINLNNSMDRIVSKLFTSDENITLYNYFQYINNTCWFKKRVNGKIYNYSNDSMKIKSCLKNFYRMKKRIISVQSYFLVDLMIKAILLNLFVNLQKIVMLIVLIFYPIYLTILK